MCNAKKIVPLLIIGFLAATEPVLAGPITDSDIVKFTKNDGITPYRDVLGALVDPISLTDGQESVAGTRQFSLLVPSVNLNVTGIAYLEEHTAPLGTISDIITLKFTDDPNATERRTATITIISDPNSLLALPAKTSPLVIFTELGEYIDITSALFDNVAAGETKTVYQDPGPPYPFLVLVFSDLDVPGVPEVPEPSALTLFGLGAVSMLSYAWRRRKPLVDMA